MAESPFHPCEPNSAAALMRSERLRVQAELIEVMAGTRETITQSRALLTEADVVLARGKLPLIGRQAGGS
jgi:hypothetical protein